MRITYIINQINGTTGLERLSLAQMDYFINKFRYGIDAILNNQKSIDETPVYNINEKINLHFLDLKHKGLSGFINRISGINRLLEEINPDIVIVCIDEVFGLYLPRLLKKKWPFIYQRFSTKSLNFVNSKGIKQHWIKNLIKNLVMSNSGNSFNRFVVLTREDKNDWKHIDKLEVIPCPNFLPTLGNQSKLDQKVVIAVGRQDYVKGYDMLLQSWKKISKTYPDWILKFYGKIEPSLKLKEIADNLGLSNSVEFNEHTTNITSVYKEASVLVCSSRTEGYPLVFLEAMSLGVPVVSFDCPNGPREIIKNYEDGILVEPNNISKLAKALESLISNDNLRLSMGRMALINSSRFSPDNVMDQWKELINEVLQERKSISA